MTLKFDNLNQAKLALTLHNCYQQHYLHPFSHALFRKKGKWETSLPPVQGKMKSNLSLPSRQEIIDWYKDYMSNKSHMKGQDRLSLSWPERDLDGVTFAFCCLFQHDFLASTVIDNPPFIQLFFKNWGNRIDKLIHLPTSRIAPFTSPSLSPHTQLILDWIRYAPTYAQQIYLIPEGSSPKILLQWLSDITRTRVFQFSCRSINKDCPEQNLLWFNNQSFHTLPQWLANQLEKSILKFYFNRNDQYASIENLKKYMQQKSASKAVAHMIEISLHEVKEGLLEKSRQSIAFLRSFEDKMKQEQQAKLINLTEDSSKKRKRRKGKQRKYSSHEESNSIKQVINNFQSLNNIQQPNQKNQNDVMGAPQFQQSAQELIHNDSNCTDHEKQPQKDINSQISSPVKSISKRSDRTCSGQLSEEQFHPDNGDEYPLRKLSIVEEMLCEQSDEKKKRRKRKTAKNIKAFEQFRDKVTHRLLNKQLDAFLDSLSAESNSNYESKVLAFERVRYFVKTIFPHAEASLFGSNAVGLSLPSSDIDIMLTGLQYSSRDALCDYLAQIGVFINSMGWIVSCSTYLGAKVPLLKLEIDTSVKYFTPKIKLDYQQVYDPYLTYFLDLRDPSASSIIKVDVTIATDSLQVSPSTQLMRSWLLHKPSIQRILLALKYTLSVRGYNQNFKGGIGSYCLFVMVLAYFLHFNEVRQQSDCQIMLDILKFYGEQFENHLKIIHLGSECCYFTNEEALQQFQLTQQLIFTNPLKILDPLNKKLMSSSCHQYSMIKSEWRRIRESILKIGQQVQQEVSTSFANLADMTKIQSNHKSFEKWVNRLQNRMEMSVGDILKGAM